MSKRKQLTTFSLLYVVLLFGFSFLYSLYISAKEEVIPAKKDLSSLINGLGTALSEGIKDLSYFLLYMVLISCLYYAVVYLFIIRRKVTLFLLLPLMNLIIFFPIAYLINAAITPLTRNDTIFYCHIALSYLLGSFVFYKWFSAEVSPEYREES